MATIRNVLFIDVYRFNSVGNQFVRKETVGLPLPFVAAVPCSPGPDGRMRVYTKITVGEPSGPPQDYYVGQTVSELAALVVQA